MSAIWVLVVLVFLVAAVIVYAGRPTRTRTRWSGDAGGNTPAYPLDGDPGDAGHHGGNHGNADAMGGHYSSSTDSGSGDSGSGDGGGGGGGGGD